ncbi:hypothetical protein [Parvularcula sp. IMCC14364]|uniref:hypothetical protein n=1 Tax=Parvularcula sp. IMCC14364 TaxID=3067902 RepID=UPI0027405CA4|nr:hypothetical protein [Parvularcula sp. IMCC14364]
MGVAAVGFSGCASVKIAMPGAATDEAVSLAGVHERAALVSATRQLDRTPWPEITEENFSGRMMTALFGGEQKNDGVSRDAALEAYAAMLAAERSPQAVLMQDANATLRHARMVSESGRQAAYAMNPSSGDISVLESAIADVRESRDMYVGTLRLLRKKGFDIDRDFEQELKKAFTQTIQDIGTSADIVADRVSSAATAQYADQQTDR